MVAVWSITTVFLAPSHPPKSPFACTPWSCNPSSKLSELAEAPLKLHVKPKSTLVWVSDVLLFICHIFLCLSDQFPTMVKFDHLRFFADVFGGTYSTSDFRDIRGAGVRSCVLGTGHQAHSKHLSQLVHVLSDRQASSCSIRSLMSSCSIRSSEQFHCWK